MGSKIAPIYATLVLAYVEEKMYKQCEKEFDSYFRKYLEANFKRFLDDCFLIFTRTEEQLIIFYYLLNSLIYNREKQDPPSFLDFILTNENGKLQTDIYYKPADSKLYLLYTLCHTNIHETAFHKL